MTVSAPRRATTWLLTLLALGVVLAACSGSEPTREATTTPDGNPSATATATPSSTATTGEDDAAAPGIQIGEVVSDLWWLWAVGGLGVGFLLGRRARPAGAPPSAETSEAPVASPLHAPAPGGETRDRELVHELVLAHDLARDEAMAGHLEQVLGRLGVAPIRVRPGMAFDSTVHRAVGTDGVGDAAHGPTIQRLVRPGWQGPDGVLRQPEVVVSAPPDTGRRDGP